VCGIAGIYKGDSRTTPDDLAAVRRMMNAQAHRGPDGKGLFRDERVVLGHRRLSIIDRSDAGRQPMSNDVCVECRRGHGTIWVSYDGGIYNFQSLRDELINHGHLFRSKTDAEVLLHGYRQWGMDGLLSRLRGTFAFALYDPLPGNPTNPTNSTNPTNPINPILFLAKDRFGIKPLYYHRDGEHLVFASEVRALMKSGLIPDEKNVEALVRFLQLGSVPVPLTTVKNVLDLPAGHYLAVNENGAELKRYWDLSGSLHPSPTLSAHLNKVISSTRSLLEESVRLHMISDVPLGLFLSGGTDSSALAALAVRFHYRPLTTLSVVFDEQDYNEGGYARMVARKFGTDHHEIRLHGRDFINEIPGIFGAMDQPTVDGVNSYFVSKAAKAAGLTVVLSGAGGDEVFLGHGHFKKTRGLERARRFLKLMPRWIRRGLIQSIIRAGFPRNAAGRDRLAYLESPSNQNCYLLFRGLFAPWRIQELLGIGEREFERLTQSPNLHSISPQSQNLLHSFTVYEFNHYLQNRLLRDIDVMSMAHSVETRVPFLDHPLVEYVAALPSKITLGKKINKPLLIKALGRTLPKKIWDRPKLDFAFPIGEWMKGRADELMAMSLEQKLFDRKAVENIWKEFNLGRAHWSRPWAMIVASHH